MAITMPRFTQISTAACYKKDDDGNLIFVNSASEELFEKMFGLKRPQYFGKRIEDVLPSIGAEWRADDLKVIASGKMSEKIETIIAPDGMISFLIVKIPVGRSLAGVIMQIDAKDNAPAKTAKKRRKEKATIRGRALAAFIKSSTLPQS